MKGVTMMTNGRRMLIGFVATSVVAFALVLAVTARLGAGADGSSGFLTFKDAANGTSLSVGLADAGDARGRFQFAVDDVGLFWPADVATVDVKSDSSAIVRYEGPGFLDAAARLDGTFGYHETSGDSIPVDLRLEMQVNPDRITATAELWSGGQQHHLVDRRAAPDADADLDSILAAIERSDWTSLYGWVYADARATIEQAEFVAQMGATFATHGTIVAVDRSGSVRYGDGRAGFDTASADVVLTMSSGGAQTVINATASLVWETDRWSLLSIAPDS
jgi:hypothetical protein